MPDPNHAECEGSRDQSPLQYGTTTSDEHAATFTPPAPTVYKQISLTIFIISSIAAAWLIAINARAILSILSDFRLIPGSIPFVLYAIFLNAVVRGAIGIVLLSAYTTFKHPTQKTSALTICGFTLVFGVLFVVQRLLNTLLTFEQIQLIGVAAVATGMLLCLISLIWTFRRPNQRAGLPLNIAALATGSLDFLMMLMADD